MKLESVNSSGAPVAAVSLMLNTYGYLKPEI
jgi:hypothetical protein